MLPSQTVYIAVLGFANWVGRSEAKINYPNPFLICTLFYLEMVRAKKIKKIKNKIKNRFTTSSIINNYKPIL